MNKSYGKIFFVATVMALAMMAITARAASQAAVCVMAQQHSDHHAGVNARGDKAMGFSHEKTTHHFYLLKDGGAIDVSANEASDTSSRDQIRMHLTHIARMFADGNFNIPMLIHDQTPPGVPLMQEKKGQINYRFEETEKGARVRISTTDDQALAAVHEFLRFQIQDHKTGDSLDITK